MSVQYIYHFVFLEVRAKTVIECGNFTGVMKFGLLSCQYVCLVHDDKL